MTIAKKISMISLAAILSCSMFITPSFSADSTCARAKIRAIVGHPYGNGATVHLINDTSANACNDIPQNGKFALSLPAEHTYKILNILLTASVAKKRLFVSFDEGRGNSPGELFAVSMLAIE